MSVRRRNPPIGGHREEESEMYGVPGVPLQDTTFGPCGLSAQVFRYGESPVWSTQFLGADPREQEDTPDHACLPRNGEISNSTFRLFTTPLGQVGQGSLFAHTIAETNMRESGRVPTGIAYDVMRVAWSVRGASDSDCAMVLDNGALAWDFTQTSVDIGPLACGSHEIGYGGTVTYMHHPISLPGNCTFAILLRMGKLPRALKRPVTFKVTLFGTYKNVIEIG